MPSLPYGVVATIPSQIETRNARIGKTFLGIEDHGIFTFILHLEGEGWGQGFGMCSLDDYDEKKDVRVGSAYGTTILMKVLETVGVNSWEELEGRYVRLKADNTRIYEIGHITRNKWLNLEDEFKRTGE